MRQENEILNPCARRIQWCMGHRVVAHESKCANLHGHNYIAWFYARADELDELGRVIDFGVLKEAIGGWIEREWDHGFLLYEHDPLATLWAEKVAKIDRAGPLAGNKHFLLPSNPTAENIARYLLEEVCPMELAGTGVEVYKVMVFETENCLSEAQTKD